MKLRSRGLGRKELIMDFRRYDIERDGDEVLITGTITEPVTWDFSIRIERDDMPGLIKVARSKAMVSLFFDWLRRARRRGSQAEEKPAKSPQVRIGKEKTGPDSAARTPSIRPAKVDSSTRRQKIEQARRQLNERRQLREAQPVATERAPSAAGRKTVWGVAKVGTIPSGNGEKPKDESKIGASQEQTVEAAIPAGGWKVRRPGAMPKVS